MCVTPKIDMRLNIDKIKIIIFSKNNSISIVKLIDDLVIKISEKCD